MIIDTHAHLNVEDYESDINDVINRAKENNVLKVIVIGMDETTSLKAIQLSKDYSELYATAGLHPSEIHDSTITFLEPLLKTKKVVAIGECGIDLYWQSDDLDLQKEIFHKQIKLAIKYDLPLVIHTRNSFLEAYEMVLPYKGKVKGVFHCFSGTVEQAKKITDLGFYIGIDGPVTFKNGQNIQEIVENIDLKWLLVETDSPYLSPAPLRGKRNEPKNTVFIANKIAEIKGISIEEVEDQTTLNATKLFKLGDMD